MHHWCQKKVHILGWKSNTFGQLTLLTLSNRDGTENNFCQLIAL